MHFLSFCFNQNGGNYGSDCNVSPRSGKNSFAIVELGFWWPKNLRTSPRSAFVDFVIFCREDVAEANRGFVARSCSGAETDGTPSDDRPSRCHAQTSFQYAKHSQQELKHPEPETQQALPDSICQTDVVFVSASGTTPTALDHGRPSVPQVKLPEK